jgi:hypothetical protein
MTIDKQGNAMQSLHKQISIEIQKNGKLVEITCDEGIAPLVKELNEAGFQTSFSCQGDDENISYVMIRNSHHKNLMLAKDIVDKYFGGDGKVVTLHVNYDGRFIFRGWTKEQFDKKAYCKSLNETMFKCVPVKKNKKK